MVALTGFNWAISSVSGECDWVAVEEASAVSSARRRGVALAERAGLPAERAAEIGLAATEAASNLYKHAQRGLIAMRVARDTVAPTIEIICLDTGPGMADVTVSACDGHSTSGTLGIGLGAIVRLADATDLHSVPGKGTVLAARFRHPERHEMGAADHDGGAGVEAEAGSTSKEPVRPGGVEEFPAYAGLTRPISGESRCGDSYAAWSEDGVHYGMLCDGLGHGPLAEVAATAAVRAVQDVRRPSGPAELLTQVHRGLVATRGAAVGIVAVRDGRARFAGTGNVAAWVAGPDRRQGMISTPGIAGLDRRQPREYSYDVPPGALVILHSDGLTGRWDLDSYPGLRLRSPLVIAATLLRDAGVRRDDSGVLVMRPPR